MSSLASRLISLGPRSGPVAIRAGRVVDGTGNVHGPSTIVTRGAHIESIALTAGDPATPPDAQVIDATGLTVMPGLVDAHIHFMGLLPSEPSREHLAPSGELKLLRAVIEAERTLAAGVTTVRHLGHGDAQLAYALRQARRESLVSAPRILTSGWALSQTRGHGDVPDLPYDWVESNRPRSAFCDGVDACRRTVRRNFGEGADLVKVYGMTNRTGRPEFTVEELAAMVDEATRRGSTVACHAKSVESAMRAVEAGVRTIEHGPATASRELAERMAERGTALVPTLAFLDQIVREAADWGIDGLARDGAARELDGRLEMVRIASDCGVTVITGSDTGGRGGFGTLSVRETELLVRAGLSPGDAIRAATSDACRVLGLGEQVGILAPGMLADIIAVAGDPLADIAVLQDPGGPHWIIQADAGVD